MQLKALIKSAAACAVIYLLLKLCFWLFSPFLIALLIAIVIEPLAKMLIERINIKRSISVAVALLFFCCISFFLSYFLVHNIYNEAAGIIKNAPLYYEKINYFVEKLYSFLKNNLNIQIDGQNINALSPEKVTNELIKIAVWLKDGILKVIYSLPDIIMYISFSIIAAFFIARDRNAILALARKILPAWIIRIASKINGTMLNIIKTELILVIISTVQTILGFIIIDVKYAVILGIISGILDILPVLGPGMLFVPWILLSIMNGKTVFAFSLACLYIIIIVTRQVLETKLISGKLNLHPLIILISIYIGLKFFGILGALLGPITAMVLKLVYQESLG